MLFSRKFIKSSQFRYLGAFYLHSLIRLFAVSIFQFFSGLYIYQLMRGQGLTNESSLAVTALFFSVLYLSMAISIVPVIWVIAKKGLRFSVFWGNMFLIGFYLIMYLSRFDPIFLFIAAIFGGLEIALYWLGYNIYFTELSDDKRQGEELSISALLSAIVLIAGPAFGGLIITYGGYGAVFLAIFVMLALAVFPLKYLPKTKDRVPVDILKITAALNPKKEFKTYLSFLGIGSNMLMYEVFWPIFTFSLVVGFAGIGFMASISAFVASVGTVFIGVLIDKLGAKKILKTSAPLESIIWVVSTLVATANQVYILAVFRGATGPALGMSFDSLNYERARHKDLVSYIVQREVCLAISRFILMFIVGIFFWFGMPLVVVFVLAAILVLLSPLYPETKLTKE